VRFLNEEISKYMSMGTGLLILGILWILFWLGPAMPLYEADIRWGHNFVIPILFITVGIAYYSKSLACQFFAVISSFLTVPLFLAMWWYADVLYIALALLAILIILYLLERTGKFKILQPNPRLKAWEKIHFLNFAYIGLAHMPLIFFLLRWGLQDTSPYLPVEHEMSTSIFNLMLLVLVPLAAMERYVKKIGNFSVTKIVFVWTILMIIFPMISIILLGE
jgi:hypothetical protein